MQDYYFLPEEDFYEIIQKEQFFRNNGLIPYKESIYGLFHVIFKEINYPDSIVEYGKIFSYIEDRQNLTEVLRCSLDLVDYCTVLLDRQKIQDVFFDNIIKDTITMIKNKIAKDFKKN